MGWMQKLYETYENCSDLVGVEEIPGKLPLLPVYHATQKAYVEAVIDGNGGWRGASVIPDGADQTTIIPCTEKSIGAANGRDPHPLFDKLKYLAGDYGTYRDPDKCEYPAYIRQLTGWCSSSFGHPKVRAILRYLQKGCLMADLIRAGVLACDATGRLPEKWDGKKEALPPIFKVCPGDQADVFVRFQVVSADGSEDLDTRPWKDRTVWQSFIDYQNSLAAKSDYCYVTGKQMAPSVLSPKHIRWAGDNAKLISANLDNKGYLAYSGHFQTPSEAFCIGRETTEKAHNALKWLIARQAYSNKEQVILAWSTSSGSLFDPCRSALDIFAEASPSAETIQTGGDFAARLKKALAGYKSSLADGEEACVLGLDSATTGRLSVFYYREMPEKDLVDRVADWQQSCSWHFWGFPKTARTAVQPEAKAKPVPFDGAPAPDAIIFAAYGENVNEKFQKSVMARLLPCIVDGAPIPQDILLCAVRRASNPTALKSDYGNTLRAACALIRKFHNDLYHRNGKTVSGEKERWQMALDPQETNRDYLFGRALAYAERLEGYALALAEGKKKEGEEEKSGSEEGRRSTNAQRLQLAFSQHPARTWKTIFEALNPYVQKLGPKANGYLRGLNQVLDAIPLKDFTNDPLSEIYLLGYACQMHQFDTDSWNAHLKKVQSALEQNDKGEMDE